MCIYVLVVASEGGRLALIFTAFPSPSVSDAFQEFRPFPSLPPLPTWRDDGMEGRTQTITERRLIQ